MKKLLIALAAAATAVVASAEITNQLDFEGADGTAYANDAPSVAANYPFASFGDKYLELDESYTPAAKGGNILDVYIQFVACDEACSLEEGEKLGVYVDKADDCLVVVGSEVTKISKVVTEGWHRLTVVPSGTADFYVYVDGVKVQENAFTGAGADNNISEMEFKGSGKLDNFVARTTDPFVTRTAEVVGIGDFATGGEYFTEVSDEAIAAAAAAGLPLKLYGNAALTATLNAGDSFTLIKGGYELTGLGDKYTVNGNTYTRVSAWSDYLGDAVAGAYEIDNLTELKAFQANVGTLPTANLTFKLTADIALDAAWEGIGVKAGKDLVNGGTKDIPTYEAGAFCGTFNGQGHTISSFQMENGTDYGGFFNSVNGATIENLNVSYKENKLCANSSATGGDTGATFVGVARNSTLQYLTALATESVDTVSASKDMAGIVAYLMAGSTVDSCTNELNVASLLTDKARKSGGIALITQEGTGTATIRNCKNSGTVTLANAGGQAGGIVGYVGQSTTIENCENTAAVKMLTHMGNTVTLQGVNKGNATVASYTGNATPGLNFATVDGDVATFVADDALVLDGTVEYKVMNANATYAFAAAGTLTLDQSLATATVTAAEGLVLTTSTSGTVTTYTAAAAVAKIGDTKYTSLAAAVDGAAEGSTIILLADVALTETQAISKSLTLDLNGHNVTATDCRAFHVKAGNVVFAGSGTISTVVTQNTALADSSSVIRVGDTAVTSFTLGENVTVTTDYCYGITYFGTMKQTVVINGTVTVTGVQAAISGNGLATYNKAAGGSDVTVNGTVSATQDYAIYNPQTGTTVINGTVTGPGGIEVKAGTVTVGANAQITATGTPSYTQSNQNGTSTVGYAIAAVGNKSYQQPATVSVASGATVTGTVIIIKENGSETYGEITSAANTLTIPAGYVWNGPADGVYTLAVASGFDGGEDGKTFNIDTAVQAALAEKIPEGKALTDAVEGTTSGVTYAQAYALGLLDEETGDVEKDVTPTIEVKNGKVVVSLDANAKDAYKVTLTVYESTSLNASATWLVKATYELDSETEAPSFTPADDAAGFYKVGVTIEDAASGN